MAAFRCRYCGRFFRPDPRKRGGSSRQKSCGQDRCRRERQRRKWQDWAKRHPDYRKSAGGRNKVKGWAKTYPDYWRRYRAEHPAYAQREKQRMSRRRRQLHRVAKQTVRRNILVEKLLAVKRLQPKSVAKQTVIARRVDALVDVLIWKEGDAKPSLIGSGAATAG